MNVVDTNVWIYCHDARDPAKQQTARRIIATAEPMALLWQVGCEFIAAARKLEPFGFTEDQAWQSLADMQAMANAVFLPTLDMWPRCRAIRAKCGIHFWDALILAACVHYGVQTLYSEDITQHDFDGLIVVNPFH